MRRRRIVKRGEIEEFCGGLGHFVCLGFLLTNEHHDHEHDREHDRDGQRRRDKDNHSSDVWRRGCVNLNHGFVFRARVDLSRETIARERGGERSERLF